ncbi:MAG: sigma-54-dependent Fis family transcriptional regulator [Planctomycetes bacterium]|nr:sigma-54-dependent Fis family transcriptional regulator [Planctomycetota bacterium]
MKSLFQLDGVHFVIGVSAVMQKVYQTILKASRTDLPVMVTGETGVGKEITARLIHFLSHRKNNPFVKVNCAALSPHLIESELFGHEKGAFTGAEITHLGRFEIANSGTFLLDEINELDIQLQAKLLQVVEDKCFERVGSSFPQKIDVRFVSTCNKDIANILKDEKFRMDLYYRLNIISIHIPPLRERKEDIIPLVQDYMGKYPGPAKRIHDKAVDLLLNYDWPGNVRELFNVMERAYLFLTDDCIMPEHITGLLERCSGAGPGNMDTLIGLPLSDIEKETIKGTLSYFDGNVQKASHVLGITDRTLRNKIKLYAINNERRLGKDVIYE